MKTLVILLAIFIAAIESVSQLPILRPSVARVPIAAVDGKDRRRMRRKVERMS